MASAAAASRPPAPPPPPPPPPPPAAAVQWLGPRVSFSLDDAGGGGGGREVAAAVAGGKAGPSAGADFEFLLGGCAAASMLPADELFSGGKLVPLRIPAPASAEEVGATTALPPKPAQAPASVATQQPETPREEEAKGVAAVGGEEPKIPARWWRDLLRLRKQQASSGSGSAAASASASEPRPLRRLLRRGPKPPEPEPSLSLPLLREAGPDAPDKLAEKPSSTPPPAPISTTPAPPQSSHHQNLPPKIRLTPSQQAVASPPSPPPPPPPPPAAVAADSPRLNAAGKVVFNGLGRSSSSPSSLAGGRRGHRTGAGGAMERSYSAHVRVAPVLNVPVCSLRGSRKSVSVFGIDRLFYPSAAAAASSSSGAAGKKGKAAKKDVTAAAAAAGPQ